MADGRNKEFLKDPVAFMKKYAVAPANYLTTKVSRNVTTDDGPQTKMVNESYLGKAKKPVANAPAGYKNNKIEPAFKVAYLDFQEKQKDVSSIFNPGNLMNAGQVMSLTGTYDPTKRFIKSYWLPWIAEGGIVRLSIPQMGFGGNHDDVKFFFTSAISGCSIFVKGTPQAPEVYHAGGDTKTGTDSAAGAKFWRDMIEAVSGTGLTEINKMDYISDPNSAKKQISTVHSEAYDQWLQNSHADLNVSVVSPWGCVMGMRDDAGYWRFYLQENASIVYAKMQKKSFLSKTKVQGKVNAVGRPMLFRQFFPGGLPQVTFTPSMQRQI